MQATLVRLALCDGLRGRRGRPRPRPGGRRRAPPAGVGGAGSPGRPRWTPPRARARRARELGRAGPPGIRLAIPIGVPRAGGRLAMQPARRSVGTIIHARCFNTLVRPRRPACASYRAALRPREACEGRAGATIKSGVTTASVAARAGSTHVYHRQWYCINLHSVQRGIAKPQKVVSSNASGTTSSRTRRSRPRRRRSL